MKSILSALLSIGAFAVLAGSTFIPRANDRTLAVSPLARGETAFVPKPDGAALYVGGDAGNLLVGDPNALRSYTYEEIPRTDFSIGASTGIVYVASNDQWRVAGSAIATETVLIAFPIGLEPSHVEMDKVVRNGGQDPTPPGEIVVHPISNGVIRVDLKRTKACSEDLYVANIRAYRLVGGAEGHVNDALSSVWLIRDSLGVFDLGDLRHEMAHKYDGNRGEDWSAYAAREDVRLDGYGLRFDPKSRYQQYVDTETNLVLQAGGIDAISVRFEGANLDPTVFAITEFTRSTNGGSFVAWTCDIDGATADDFDVIWASKLNQSDWTSFTDAECEITHNELTDEWNAWIPGRDADAEFYRINYHGVVSEVLQVTLRGEVTIPDALLLGTGTNAVNVAAALSSKLTGIDVNGERAPVTNGVAYVRVSGGGGTDGEAVTNIVRSLAYTRDGANEIISNRWTAAVRAGILFPDRWTGGAGGMAQDGNLVISFQPTNETMSVSAKSTLDVAAVYWEGTGFVTNRLGSLTAGTYVFNVENPSDLQNPGFLPKGYRLLSSIETDGRQWLDTGVTPQDEQFGFYLDFEDPCYVPPTEPQSSWNGAAILGCGTAPQWHRNGLQFENWNEYDSSGYFNYGGFVHCMDMTGYNPSFQAWLDPHLCNDRRMFVTVKNGLYTIAKSDGSTYSEETQASTNGVQYYVGSIYLAAIHGESGAESWQGNHSMRFHRLKFFNGSTLVYDAVPAVEEATGRTGMYRISGTEGRAWACSETGVDFIANEFPPSTPGPTEPPYAYVSLIFRENPVTNRVPYALMTDIPTAAEWQALKTRLAEIEARLDAMGGE